jgi:hypothetical protein
MITFDELIKAGDADSAVKDERYAQAAKAASDAGVQSGTLIRDYAGRYQILVAGYGLPRIELCYNPPVNGDEIPA